MLISAIIIAKNEEKKIKDCLSSIKKLCDEVILVDSGSEDKTLEIAKKFEAHVYKSETNNFSRLRNEGLKHAKGVWVLYIDADERITPELAEEILEKIKDEGSGGSNIFAYAIPRRNFILGKELKYGGWWPDYVKRLFKKEKLKKWVGELHEEPIFDGNLGLLKNPLLHIKHDNLEDMVVKTNAWSEIEAKLMYKARHPKMNIFRFCSAVFREFWLRFIKEKAFLDGKVGIIYAVYQVYSKFFSYAKLWEMQLKQK